MPSRGSRFWWLLCCCLPIAAAAQSARPMVAASLELPLYLNQKIVAGTTPAGTVVKARLTIATLVRGAVIPEGAILTGEVESSVAHTSHSAARLCIHFSRAEWKRGTLALDLYLGNVYLPHRILYDKDGQPEGLTVSSLRMPLGEIQLQKSGNGHPELVAKESGIQLDTLTVYIALGGIMPTGQHTPAPASR